jgi:MFS family permease
MLFFRFLQGVGAALVLSCSAALVVSLYGEERRSRALGIYTMMLSVGLTLGPLLGGALTAAWSWPTVFWFRVSVDRYSFTVTDLPSRPGELHPESLTEPCLTVSSHTARATH